MSDWDDLLQPDNFQLAWRRILRSKHYQVKDRLGFRVFEANLKENIRYIIEQIEQGVFQPELPEKIYAPKRPGTVRSLPVLSISDRLVYQAIINIIDGYVFAHLLNQPNDDFVIRRWDGFDGQYRKYLAKFRDQWERGNSWIVQADIASYYDSIDHELLIKDIKVRWVNCEKTMQLLNSCLRSWSPHEEGDKFSRGLPQGYEASDYLATIYLLATDEKMLQKYTYLRYVDDIRILANNQDTVRRALIDLDVSLKKQALILQPSKTGAKEIKNINEEIDELAGALSMIDERRRRGDDIDEEAEELFFKSWHQLDEREHAEAHLIFAINRIPPSRQARPIALSMLKKMPWRSNSITSYLSEFINDKEVITSLIREIGSHKAYAWHLANCLRALSKIASIEDYREICREWISNYQLRWFQRLAAVECLQNDYESYSFLLLSYKNEPSNIIKASMLVAAAFSANTDDQRAMVIRTGMKDRNGQVKATAIWLYLEFRNCGIKLEEISPDMGVHRNMIPEYSEELRITPCYIDKVLSETFDLQKPDGVDYRKIFEPDYEQARSHLLRAMRYHDTDPVTFITSIDNFNQIIAIVISEKVDAKKIPRDDYSNIVNSMLAKHIVIASVFINCHELRSKSRGPHAWATSLGNWSIEVDHRKKNEIVKKLKIAYQEFINLFN
jgi:hypothetical protein